MKVGIQGPTIKSLQIGEELIRETNADHWENFRQITIPGSGAEIPNTRCIDEHSVPILRPNRSTWMLRFKMLLIDYYGANPVTMLNFHPTSSTTHKSTGMQRRRFTGVEDLQRWSRAGP